MPNGELLPGTLVRILPRNGNYTTTNKRLLLVGDGYSTADYPTTGAESKFEKHYKAIVAAIEAEDWYRDLRPGSLEVWAMDVVSTDQGIDNEPPGNTMMHATYFNGIYAGEEMSRLIQFHGSNGVPSAKTAAKKKAKVGFDSVAVITNSDFPGGSWYYGSVFVSGGAANSGDLFLHEFGHWCTLYDEYSFWSPEIPGGNAVVTIAGPNVDDSSGVIRDSVTWSSEIRPSTPLPTYTVAGGFAAGVPSTTTRIGTFEGAQHFVTGAYRPAVNCKMKALKHDFCRVCAETILTFLST